MGKKIKAFLIIVFVILGIIGGILIKYIFFQESSQIHIKNEDANRLLYYLSVEGYELPDKPAADYNANEAKKLMDQAGCNYEKLNFDLKKMRAGKALTLSQFQNIYDVLIQELGRDRIAHIALYISDINSESNEEIDGIYYTIITTNEGKYYMNKEYALDETYIGKIVSTYISNNEIIFCFGESDGSATIYNVWLGGAGKTEDSGGVIRLKIFMNGTHHTLDIAEGIEFEDEITKTQGCLSDIMLTNEGVTGITLKNELNQVRVTAVTAEGLTLEGYNTPMIPSENYKIYKVYGNNISEEKTSAILLGYEKIEMLITDNIIEAALITEPIQARNIRVLLNNSDYSNYYHREVAVTSETDFTLKFGNTLEHYKAGEKISLRTGSDQFRNNTLTIFSDEEEGKIIVSSHTRQSGNPAYRGTLELSKSDKGILLINELPMEEYLYSVVSSEMPSSFEIEALKAQAVCARSYAYNKMMEEAFLAYGAHLDDSVMTQVYNNVEETEKSIFAVKDTYGVIACYGNDVIHAYFFSTSCGTTSNNTDVWGGTREPYLLDSMETELNEMAELSNEIAFRNLIDGNTDYELFEKNTPFFRWSVTFTREKFGAAINAKLNERRNAMPENILAKNPQGQFEKKAIASIGDFVSIEVTKRGNSGIILEMLITGTQEVILVKGQTNVRALLSPENVAIRKQDGSTVNGWASLPSAYLYIEDADSNIILHGGGFGHGSGMSQHGANEMAKLGYLSNEIIVHYYTGITLQDVYRLEWK